MHAGRPHGASGAGGWTVARLQRIGNWGRADEALGRHWEQVGLLALAGLLGALRTTAAVEYVPRAVLPLAENEDLRRAIHASGLPNPDACLVGSALDGVGVLQPADFKWSLERAELPQVAATTIARLLDADVPGLAGHLRVAHAAADLGDRALRYVDGFFFAPDHAENRAFLASQANARAEFPLAPGDVVLSPVEPQCFFQGLPGWHVGRWLADTDRGAGLLATVEGAERYFRLGAGFAGALVRLATPLFADQPAQIDVPAELRRLRSARRLFTSGDLAGYLERQMAARALQERALRDLLAAVYSFQHYRAQLAALGVKLDDLEDDAKRGFRERYRVARKSVADRLRREGQARVAAGRSEATALAELQARTPELAKLAQTVALRVLGAAI